MLIPSSEKIASLICLCILSIGFTTTPAKGQGNLIELKIALSRTFEWVSTADKPDVPPTDSGKFTIPGPGRARFTYSGNPMVTDQQIWGLELGFPGAASSFLPGRTVDDNKDEKKNTVGQPFVWTWIQEFNKEAEGMEVRCTLKPIATYRSALPSAVYPAQDALFRVEWLGDNAPGNEPIKGLDPSGVWKHGSNGESWTFTRNPDGSYTAVEQGFGDAKGTATIQDNTILIDYTTSNGINGKYTINVDSTGNKGTGKWTSDLPDSGTRDFVRVSTGTSSDPSGSDSAAPGTDAIKGFTVRAGRQKVKAGETAQIAIDLLQPSNLGNLNVNIEYDPAVVKVNSTPTAGSAKGNRLFEANHRQAGIVRLGLAGSDGLTSDGQLASIPFTAIGAPGSSTNLKVTVTIANDSEGKSLTAATLDGAIEIAAAEPPPPPPTPKFTAKDALDALKMSVQLLAEDLRADLDKDGKVTSNDARLILRTIVTAK